MKKSVSILLSVLFLAVTLLSFTPLAFAQSQTTDVKKTQLGSTDTYYQYNASQKLLTISGNGATASFSDNGVGQPWYDWRGDSIDKGRSEEHRQGGCRKWNNRNRRLSFVSGARCEN